jgi:hypothetical protein
MTLGISYRTTFLITAFRQGLKLGTHAHAASTKQQGQVAAPVTEMAIKKSCNAVLTWNPTRSPTAENRIYWICANLIQRFESAYSRVALRVSQLNFSCHSETTRYSIHTPSRKASEFDFLSLHHSARIVRLHIPARSFSIVLSDFKFAVDDGNSVAAASHSAGDIAKRHVGFAQQHKNPLELVVGKMSAL